MFAFKFSFSLRYYRDVRRSVLIPVEKLAGLDFAAFSDQPTDLVMAVIEKDDTLIADLFGDFASEYRELAAHRDLYWKDLQRNNEELVLVAVEDDAQ